MRLWLTLCCLFVFALPSMVQADLLNGSAGGGPGADPPLVVGVDWFATTAVPPAFFWSSIGPASDGPFTFSAAFAVNVYITDDFDSGDRFEIKDFGSSLGLTSVPTFADTGEKGPAVAFLDPDYSHGVFTVGAGSHSITIDILPGSFSGGRGYIKAEAAQAVVPEPCTLVLAMVGGCGGLIGHMARRRKAKIA